jgi:hypothetical protein
MTTHDDACGRASSSLKVSSAVWRCAISDTSWSSTNKELSLTMEKKYARTEKRRQQGKYRRKNVHFVKVADNHPMTLVSASYYFFALSLLLGGRIRLFSPTWKPTIRIGSLLCVGRLPRPSNSANASSSSGISGTIRYAPEFSLMIFANLPVSAQ